MSKEQLASDTHESDIIPIDSVEFDQYASVLSTVENIKSWQRLAVIGCTVMTAAGILVASVESRNTCIEPTAADFAAVDTAIADNSGDPLLHKDHPKGKAQAAWESRRAFAKSMGLTFHEAPDNGVKPANSALDDLKTVAASYGLQVTIESKQTDEIPTAEELNSEVGQRTIGRTEVNLEQLSDQFIRNSGYRGIVFYSSARKADKGAAAYASINGDNLIHVELGTGTEALAHEIGHFEDNQDCGDDMVADPHFRELNNGHGVPGVSQEVYMNQWPVRPLTEPEKMLSLEEYGHREGDLQMKLLEASVSDTHPSHDDQPYCTAEKLLSEQAEHVIVVDDYSLNTDLEDKANIYAALETPKLQARLFNRLHPMLYRKARYIAARWMHRDPLNATYALRVGSRPVEYCPEDQPQ